MTCLPGLCENSSKYHSVFNSEYPVSKGLAEKKFSALGENWWKQIYDGKYHSLGKMVFDEGLHKRDKEPGFYESALKAFNYAKENLGKKVSVEFYQSLHKIACGHFQGKKNNTGMNSSEAGVFRKISKFVLCTPFLVSNIVSILDRNSLNFSNRSKSLQDFESLRAYNGDNLSYESLLYDFRYEGKDITAFDYFEYLLNSNYKDVSDYIKKLEKDSALSHSLPQIKLNKEYLYIFYRHADFDVLVKSIFTKFNEEISEIDTKLQSSDSLSKEKTNELLEDKLILIADLYQKLEWIHPFRDGQGRTDLILLSKLLAENGFTPAILNEPYVSSFVPLKTWVQYLKEGMLAWKTEAL